MEFFLDGKENLEIPPHPRLWYQPSGSHLWWFDFAHHPLRQGRGNRLFPPLTGGNKREGERASGAS